MRPLQGFAVSVPVDCVVWSGDEAPWSDEPPCGADACDVDAACCSVAVVGDDDSAGAGAAGGTGSIDAAVVHIAWFGQLTVSLPASVPLP